MLSQIKNSLKTINYKLWIAILIMMLLPTIYQTVRIHFLGNLPGDWGFNIASQLSWVSLFYEVIQEAMILPLFFLLGKSLFNKSELENKIKSGLLITGLIYSVLSLLIIIFAGPLVEFMGQDKTVINETIAYIRLETIATLFSTLVRFLMLVFISLKKDKIMYLLLSVQMILSIILDTFFISNLTFSLNIGVNGVAISNIIVNIFLLFLSILILSKKLDIHLINREKINFSWMKEWLKVGKYSGLESFLRNFAFMMMILRMVNMVSEQGNYWIANNFIWHWLLLPGLALADVVKKEVAENKDNIEKKTFGYISLVIIFSLFWILTIPLWKTFIDKVLNVDDFEVVYKIVLIQTGFYLTFLFNSCIFDSTFYGLGKTNYMLIQSICIDVIYYGFMYVLYKTNIFIPTLISISLMFGIGMVLDFIPTMILYIRLLRKENYSIDFSLKI